MTQHTQGVRAYLTPKSLLALLRTLVPFPARLDPCARIREHAEQARFDHMRHLIDAWAEVQTEALMRELLTTPQPWMAYRMETAR